jgi:hypothetical protein
MCQHSDQPTADGHFGVHLPPMLRRLTIFVTLALAVPDASAADAQNLFKTGGGVGAVKCPEFLNVMADARQRGGVATVGGVNAVTAYLHYVLGFQTGFNAEAEGVYDIFAGLGTTRA